MSISMSSAFFACLQLDWVTTTGELLGPATLKALDLKLFNADTNIKATAGVN